MWFAAQFLRFRQIGFNLPEHSVRAQGPEVQILSLRPLTSAV